MLSFYNIFLWKTTFSEVVLYYWKVDYGHCAVINSLIIQVQHNELFQMHLKGLSVFDIEETGIYYN